MWKKRLGWYGHVCERDEDIKRLYVMRAEGSKGRGRAKQRWSDTVNGDLCWLDLGQSDTSDRVRWNSLV